FRTNDEGYLQGKGEVAIGDELITLWPLPQTPVCNTYSSSDVPQQIASNGTPLVNSSLTVNHMGRVVDVNVRQLSGSHSYMGDLSISLESPEGTKQEIMARACGNADDFDLDFDDQVELGAWPCPPTNLDINERTYQPSNPLSVFNDENSNGVWTLSIQDDVSGDGGQLDHWALELCTVNPNYTLYHINATPINNGLRGDSVEVFGTQELTVSAPHPLLLFHLDISLEWDASTSYLESLKKDIQRASEIFFDLSNGQAALGEVTVYQNKEKWEDSHVIVHAANNVRPSASMGGLVVSPTQEIDGNGQVIEDAYLPGQLSMGPTWGRFGEPNADLGEDWPRALAHELGHYLFFLPDNYLGIADGKLIATDCDGSVMTDAYPEEYSEYLTSNEWNGDCLNTVAEQATGRTDWETITHFYPQLRSDNQLRGPNSLPIQAQVSFPEPTNPVATLQAPFFTLRDEDGKRLFVPQGQGEGYLFKNWDESNLSESYVIPLGSPVGNQINARGAAAGDRLCVYDHSQDTVRLGCTIVEEIEGPITLNPLPNWRPQIRVSVLNTLTLDIEVTQPLTSGDLYVQILPSSRLDSTTPQISTVQQLTRINDNTFGAQVTLPYPTGQAFVRVWVEGSDPPQEAMSQFFLGSGWGANRLAWGANRLAWGANRLAWGAPVASGDGQVMILNLENIFADTGTSSLQSLNTPPLMPVWLTPVGQAYRFEASEQSKRTIAFNYLQSEVPGGETYEHLLRIYYSPDEGQSWQRLETEFNQQINLASATMPTERRGEGIYALLSTIEIPPFERRWNLFGYPVPGSRPLATGLASIEGLYTSILTYEPFDKLRNRPPGQGRWLLYDKRVISQHPRWAPLINDLTELEFGRGYWIYATEPITLYLGLPDDNDQNNQNNRSPLMGDLEAPPTTFYGPITGPLAPSVGTPITAMINGVVCGRSTVQEWERAVAYKIQVSSDTGDGCGETDDTVVFALDGQLLPTSNNRLWDNSGAQYHTLQAIEDNNVITLYLPLIRNGSGGLYLPLLRNSD
ncbi:MAG: proprotein convertase P-domain-containing protein, partial [Ardenticatenaceae bacterium]